MVRLARLRRLARWPPAAPGARARRPATRGRVAVHGAVAQREPRGDDVMDRADEPKVRDRRGPPECDGHDVVELDAPRRAAHAAAGEGPLTLALVADEDLAPHGSRDVALARRGRGSGRGSRGARLLHEAPLPVARGEE